MKKGRGRAGQLVGYLRVSSLDQKELRQLEGIALDKRFVDLASGKDLHRPQLEQLTGYVREGDMVICHSMDRLARNLVNHLVRWSPLDRYSSHAGWTGPSCAAHTK